MSHARSRAQATEDMFLAELAHANGGAARRGRCPAAVDDADVGTRNTQTRATAHWPDSMARTRVTWMETNIAESWPLTSAGVVNQFCWKMMSPDCRLHVFSTGWPHVLLGIPILKNFGAGTAGARVHHTC